MERGALVEEYTFEVEGVNIRVAFSVNGTLSLRRKRDERVDILVIGKEKESIELLGQFERGSPC